jgi:sulfur carrier protein
MEVFVNGIAREFPPPLTVAALLQAEGQAGRRVAVEVNREIVPRSGHAAHALAAGDRVEIIQAIGGG